MRAPLVALMLAVLLLRPSDARPQPPHTNKQTASATPRPTPAADPRAAYAARVLTLESQFNTPLAEMLVSLDHLDEIYQSLARRHKTDEALTDEEKDQAARLRANLRGQIGRVAMQSRRLGTLSPVPRSLKKADDALIEFSLEMDRALECLNLWLDHPVAELVNETNKHLRRAQTLLDTALKTLRKSTDPAIYGKTYLNA